MGEHATPYPHLFTPLRAGHLELQNRLVMGSMHTALERHADGFERLAAFYAARARGGAGLLVTGGFAPDGVGSLGHDPRQVFDAADQVPEHRLVTDAVHREGAPILLQLLHGGRYSRHAGNVAPSAVPSRINKHVPRAMTAPEIEATIAAYARTAALAREAGYDGVEVMGSEGYLLTQFATPFTNRREDEWGGDIHGRARFPCAVVRAVRAAAGADFMIMYRLSTLDLIPGGNTWDETVTLAQALEAAGVDVFNTGIGWHEARIPTIAHMVPRGVFAPTAARLRRAVNVPVMASNRINNPADAEAIVAGGVDLISLARPFLADADFAAKARAGQAARINTCIGCNQACLDNIFTGQDCSCLVNPAAGRESIPVPPAAARRTVAVVGGGPAGMACAAEAARRGHRVTLFESAPTLGGQFNLARVIPGKADYGETIRHFNAELAHLGVTVCLGEPATADALTGHDAVVLACGVRPRVPDLPGADHPSVVDYAQVLSGAVRVGRRVVILGAGGIGVDTALFLALDGHHPDGAEFLREWGVDLSVATPGGLREPHIAPARRDIHLCWRSAGVPGQGLGLTTSWVHRAELERRGVQLHGNVRYLRVDDAGVHIEENGAVRILPADHVVLCVGQEPQTALADALAARGVAVHAIGGARDAQGLNAVRAIAEGVAAAQAIR